MDANFHTAFYIVDNKHVKQALAKRLISCIYIYVTVHL